VAGQSISIPILTPGADRAARDIKQVGNAAAETGAKLDFAAGSLKLFNETTLKTAKADQTLVQSAKTHAKALGLIEDAERVLGGQATKTTKLFADQGRKFDDSGKSAITLADRFGALAGTGGIAGGGMGAAVAAGIALSGQIATVGIGLGGLAGAAYGVAKPIEEAAKKAGGLEKNLHTLDPQQQAVAKSLLSLEHQYDSFQKSLAPQVLTSFNTGFRIAGHLMSDVQPIARQTGIALNSVLNSVDREFQSGTWQQFFAFMAREAGPDTRQLGQLFTDLLEVLPGVVQDLHPLGSALITVADDTAKAVGGIQRFYDSFQKNVPISNQNAGNFLKNLDHWTVELTNHIPGAQAVNNWLTNVQHNLTGTGDSAQHAVPHVQAATQAVSDMMKTTVTTVTPVDRLGKAAATTSFTVSEYGKNANLTVTPVDRLGRVSDVSAASVGHVATAADFANTKIINVRHSVQDLTTALSKGLDPLLNYSNGLITQRDDAKNLAQALKASGNTIGLQTDKQKASFSAANTYIKDLENTASNALAAHKGINQQITSLQNALPALEHAQSHSRLYWQEVRTLINYLDRLRRERDIREAVTVFGTGTWSLSQPGGKLAGPTGTAGGWLVSGGTPGRDSVPIMAMPGELVVPRRMVASGAVDHLRGSIPGFAEGGIVPKYSGQVAGLPPWISRNQAATVHAVTASIAGSFARSFASLFAGAGGVGFGGGVRQWAPLVLRVLAMLGQPAADLGVVLSQMQTESGGRVNAINLTDSNAAMGDPSRGLMQVIGSTFAAYAGPFRGLGIYNPLANIYAGLNYAIHRYGPAWTRVLGQGHGYDSGGFLPPGLSLAYNGTGRPELVTPAGRGGGGTTVVNVNVTVGHGTHPVAAAQEIAKVLNQGAALGGVRLRKSILGPV
jgi:hypothetical protein